MTLYDLMQAAVSGPWTTAGMDTQYAVKDTPRGRMLAFQGTDVDVSGGWIRGSLQDLKADVINAFPDMARGWMPLGLSQLYPTLAEILRAVGPFDFAAGWSLGGMLAREAMPGRYVAFGSPRTRVLWHEEEPGGVDVILRRDGLARGFYLGYKRTANSVYIGPRGLLDARAHSIDTYLAVLAEAGI